MDLNQQEKKKAEQIELRSYEVQELLGQVPRWIIRWGISLISGIILILLLGSWLFRYPEIQPSGIILTTENPPVNLVAKTSGKIQNLFVTDNQLVQNGQVLAIIETASDYFQMDSVKLLSGIIYNSFRKKEFIDVNDHFSLGVVQNAYTDFIKSYRRYENFVKLDVYDRKINALNSELLRFNRYSKDLQSESLVLKKKYLLEIKQYQRDSLMFQQGVFSVADLEKAEGELLEREFAFREAETAISNARLQIEETEQQILALKLEKIDEESTRKNEFEQAYEQLLAEIDLWEQKHILRSPVKGRITFTKFWAINQNVMQDESVLTVIPEDTGEIIGKIKLSTKGAGKVKTGQKVNIKFDNYPYMQFGMVQGVVTKISQVPEHDEYIAEIRLPQGMVTNYGNTIEFRQNMPGIAEIITENMSLIRKILFPVKHVIKKQQTNRE